MKPKSLIALILTALMPFLMASSCNIQSNITGISAKANPTSLPSGGTSSLSANVNGTSTFNPGVTWSIVSGGGTLSSNSGSGVTYTAPTVTSATTVQIVAAAAGDGNFSQTLNLNVTPVLPAIIPDTTKVTDASTRSALSAYDKTSGTMRFSQSTPVLASLKPGDVLVSEPSSAAPNGYLRKVTSSRTEGSEMILETTQAKLTEAVSQGTLNANFDLTAANLKTTNLIEGVTITANALPRGTRAGIGENYNFKLSFRQVFVPLPDENQNVSGQITIDGTAEFNAGYGVHVGISGCFDLPPVCVDNFETKIGFDQTANLHVSGDVTGQVGKEINVGNQIFQPITFFIGPVPVVIVPRIDFYLSLSGQIEAKFDFQASERAIAQIGARWTPDDGWKNISDFDFNGDIPTPTLTGNLKPRAATRSSASMLLYDVAGPEVSLAAGLELNGQIPGNPTWIVSGFLKGTLGFKVELPILGRVVDYQTTLFDTTREFARSGNTPPTITLTRNALPLPNTFPPNAPRKVIVGLPENFTSGCGIIPGYYFNVFDLEDGCGIGVTVVSDVDGTLPKKYTFQTEGLRTISVTARDQPGLSVSKTFKLFAYNPAPDLTFANTGDPQQGENYSVAALITDVNELDARTLCANTTWAVDAPDTLKSTVGCLQKVKFATQGPRQVRVTTRDSYGAASSKILTLNVVAPPVNPYPRVTNTSLNSREIKNSGGADFCVTIPVPEGATINLSDKGCLINPTPGQPLPNRYFIGAAIENPSNEVLTYDWVLYAPLSSPNYTGNIFDSNIASPNASFELFDPVGGGGIPNPPDINNCTVTLKVNAPDSARSKGPNTEWTGKCRYSATRLN
jgi:hypothetical protein